MRAFISVFSSPLLSSAQSPWIQSHCASIWLLLIVGSMNSTAMRWLSWWFNSLQRRSSLVVQLYFVVSEFLFAAAAAAWGSKGVRNKTANVKRLFGLSAKRRDLKSLHRSYSLFIGCWEAAVSPGKLDKMLWKAGDRRRSHKNEKDVVYQTVLFLALWKWFLKRSLEGIKNVSYQEVLRVCMSPLVIKKCQLIWDTWFIWH